MSMIIKVLKSITYHPLITPSHSDYHHSIPSTSSNHSVGGGRGANRLRSAHFAPALVCLPVVRIELTYARRPTILDPQCGRNFEKNKRERAALKDVCSSRSEQIFES